MADSKGTEPKPTETKTGPVKPPVLDLKARAAEPEPKKPEPKPAVTEDKPSAPKAAPSPSSAAPAIGGVAIGAAVAGGVLGLAAAYGLALAGLWPSTPAVQPAADPRLAQFSSAIPELETVTQTTQSELAALNQRIALLEAGEPAAATATPQTPVDLSGVEADIAALANRMDSLSAVPAAPADSAAVDALRADLASVGSRLDELGARLGTAEAGLRTLDTTVTQTTETLASQPSDISAVLQLPLILSGLETAFANGRPYESELAALRAATPDAAVPTEVANAAATGLPRPDAIARRFDSVFPAILAGRPVRADAQWQDGALDWFASAIALRPAGEMEGDSPEAIATQLEGAIARRDFAAAETLFARLPAGMQSAAEDVPALVATQAVAARFLDDVRARALSGEAAQ